MLKVLYAASPFVEASRYLQLQKREDSRENMTLYTYVEHLFKQARPDSKVQENFSWQIQHHHWREYTCEIKNFLKML